MIYPTPRAIVLAAAGVPVGLMLGAVAPGWWMAGAVWALAALALTLADAFLAASPGDVTLHLEPPAVIGVGRQAEARVRAAFSGSAPSVVELALGVNDRLTARPRRSVARVEGREARAAIRLTPHRRGEALFERLWARWRGPLGLAWIQRVDAPGVRTPIAPDIHGVKEEALRLFTRDAPFGAKAQIETGEGSEFHALKEYAAGMDPRSVDWKQSARHGRLVGKEYHTERNHQVVLALDTGRVMSAPLGGVPRIDRAINAALLLAFVSLKMGDRVGLFAFDARPRAASGAASGMGAFPLLQRLAAGIDYSAEETNYTLGLTALSGRLDRRALVVVFTDFADPTSAELMVENVARLLRTHFVLFVVFRDDELEGLVDAAPEAPEDVSRAAIAGALVQQRELVLERLKRLGARIVDAPVEAIGPALVARYLDTKRRDLL